MVLSRRENLLRVDTWLNCSKRLAVCTQASGVNGGLQTSLKQQSECPQKVCRMSHWGTVVYLRNCAVSFCCSALITTDHSADKNLFDKHIQTHLTISRLLFAKAAFLNVVCKREDPSNINAYVFRRIFIATAEKQRKTKYYKKKTQLQFFPSRLCRLLVVKEQRTFKILISRRRNSVYG